VTNVILLAHIPLLRIESESIPFARGALWAMPFEVFDDLTVRAFSDHRARYEETAPVFYRIDLPIDLPSTAGRERTAKIGELKVPTDDWRALLQELGFIVRFHDALVDQAWLALLLGAPAGAFPSPRMSVTFAVTPDGEGVLVGAEVWNHVRVQGDADVEYCFLPEAAGTPLSDEMIARASGHLASLETLTKNDELRAAVRTLADATDPSLGPAEQLTLTVMALEELLMPEVRSSLGATFARRLADLFALDAEHRDQLQNVGRVLYDARSAALHGERPRSPQAAAGAARLVYGQQFLAGAIETLAARAGGAAGSRPLRLPLADPPALRPPERLLHQRTSVAAVMSGQRMEAPEGVVMNWVPLIGLAGDDEFKLDGGPLLLFMPMSGPELVSMEERDIRRDFAAQLYVPGVIRPIACFAAGEKAADPDTAQALFPVLERRRDLAVAALRVAGFDDFHDPELLGTYIFHGFLRYRRPTILRQTLLQMVRQEPAQRITAADAPRVSGPWRLLTRYDAAGRHEEIESVLRLFRRAFDRRFLPVTARASLMLATLESMLGRFRAWKDPVQLDDFVTLLMGAGSDAAAWFAAEGRQFRNSVAHGTWRADGADPALANLLDILRAVIVRYVEVWLDRPATENGPAAAFVAHLAAEVEQ
jgi:hypothetical protein